MFSPSFILVAIKAPSTLYLCKTRLIPVEVCLIVEGDYRLLTSDVTFETCCIISS